MLRIIPQEIKYHIDKKILTREEIKQDKSIPYGIYFSICSDIVGVEVLFHIPQHDPDNKSLGAAFDFIVGHLEDYKDHKEEISQMIKQDSYVKWRLIPCIFLKLHGDGFFKKTDFIQHKQLFKDFFSFLLQCGAEYKHIFDFGILKDTFLLENVLLLIPSIVNDAVINPLLYLGMQERFSAAQCELMLQAGANINCRMEEFQNTPLLKIISTEDEELCLQWISCVESLKGSLPTTGQIDYTLQDSMGKTPLAFATGLGFTKLVVTLLSLGKDVGINIPDNQGCTPLMYAAALGHQDIFAALIKAKADIDRVDEAKHDVQWYLNPSIEVIRGLLTKVSILPDRVDRVTANYFYGLAEDGYLPVDIVDQTGSKRVLDMSLGSNKTALLKQAAVSALSQKIDSDPSLPLTAKTEMKEKMSACIKSSQRIETQLHSIITRHNLSSLNKQEYVRAFNYLQKQITDFCRGTVSIAEALLKKHADKRRVMQAYLPMPKKALELSTSRALVALNQSDRLPHDTKIELENIVSSQTEFPEDQNKPWQAEQAILDRKRDEDALAIARLIITGDRASNNELLVDPDRLTSGGSTKSM